MPALSQYANDPIVNGTSGEDYLNDISSLVKNSYSNKGFFHGTTIYGHGGNDWIFGESGTGPNKDWGLDYFDGGAGIDTINYLPSNAGMVVDLTYYSATGGRAYAIGHPVSVDNPTNRLDQLANIENVYGSMYADHVTGSDVANNLSGADGNDDIFGKGGNDTLGGGNGNDTIRGDSGDDQVNGDNGNDVLFGGTGMDTLNGGDDNDSLYGGDHNDILHGDGGYNKLYGNDGNDSLYIGEQGEGDGGAGNDTILGGNLNDKLEGGSGNDALNGMGGNDVLASGIGNDTINGGAGSDTGIFTDMVGTTVYFTDADSGFVVGNTCTDTFHGLEIFKLGGGVDNFDGSSAANTVYLGEANDLAYGAGGNDLLDGEAGSDTLYGNHGNDMLFGGAANDILYGGENNDVLSGGDQNDQLYGGSGNDTLNGGSGSDMIDGASGNDTLHAEGSDILIGGSGNDVINLASQSQEIRWLGGHTGVDTINGFNITQDELTFSRSFFAGTGPIDLADQLMVAYSGNDTLLIANTAATGWDIIAMFNDVSAGALGQAIENGSVVTLIGVTEAI